MKREIYYIYSDLFDSNIDMYRPAIILYTESHYNYLKDEQKQ